tara:strand:+ start:1201 stop:1404 length:204 start_codon:yes stop_codon:yes gene_type:complete
MQKIKKIFYGFVIQEYVDGSFVSQEFIASDQVDFEIEDGDIPDNVANSHISLEMVQPISKKRKKSDA